MTIPGIWTKDDERWRLTGPDGFPDEATLRDLIQKTPEMLPLAGTPGLLILGTEVLLGSGYADFVGVETSGRPVIIEVKLAKNHEARRAVVAQILAYAASLHGMTREQLEGRFGDGLQNRGYPTLLDAVNSAQEEVFDAEGFTAALEENLREGRFRLVFVLDSVPRELMTLVAYLEHVTDKLVIDLVAVHSFDIGGTSVVIPQRVTPERHEVTAGASRRSESSALYYRGSEEFEANISEASPEHQESLGRLLLWARELEQRGLAMLWTTEGTGGRRFVLNPLLKDDSGLVSIWNEGGASLSFWRSVFERRAPDFIERVEELTGNRMGQGSTTRHISEDLLTVLTETYEHAHVEGAGSS